MDYTVHRILQTRIVQWVTIPFSRGFSQTRNQTQVSCIAGRFFTSWATREAQEYWRGQPIPSPADLPDPGIKSGSSALQADSLPTIQSLGWEDPPGEGNGNPLQYFCLGNPIDRGTWWATVHGVAKSQTRLSNFSFHFQSICKQFFFIFLRQKSQSLNKV